MAKVIVINGYGPGISHAIAERFGAEGFSIVVAARNAAKLAEGARQLEGKGYQVLAVPTDASNLAQVKALIEQAKAKFGGVDVLQWNAASPGAGDLLSASLDEFKSVLDTGVTGLLAAVQAALPELKRAKDGAVLVTDGGYGVDHEGVDGVAVQYGAMGLAVANAAKHKLVRLLHKRLATEGVYAGEVMVMGSVKGTAWDQGNATIEAKTVAEQFWKLYRERKDVSVQVK